MSRRNNKKKPVLYGFHAVAESWLNPARRIQALYMTKQAESNFAPILKQAKTLDRPSPTFVEKHELEKMLPKGAVHQGLALACDPLEDIFIQDLIIKAENQERTTLLILDQVTDPHNVGAIIRSACAFGTDGLIMQRKHAPELTGVLAKTACGGVEHMPIAFETNLSRSIEQLQENGFFVFGLDERGEQTIGQIDHKSGKLALVLGAEGPGIRRLVKEHCDALIKLPTQGPIQSLNVSNAAAISLYALQTQKTS